MNLNIDLSQRVVIDTTQLEWSPSPLPGVERRRLERDAAESGRATSIVRYASGASFSSHVHEGGEEIYVLEGSLSDESGTFPAGSYLRNPPGSSHAPRSEAGCLLFVKLCQMDGSQGASRLVVDTRKGEWIDRGKGKPKAMPLFSAAHGEAGRSTSERVALSRFAPGDRVENDLHHGGEEVLVLEGVLEDEYGRYPQGTWLRQPDGSSHTPFSTEGCLLFVKRGHLCL